MKFNARLVALVVALLLVGATLAVMLGGCNNMAMGGDLGHPDMGAACSPHVLCAVDSDCAYLGRLETDNAQYCYLPDPGKPEGECLLQTGGLCQSDCDCFPSESCQKIPSGQKVCKSK